MITSTSEYERVVELLNTFSQALDWVHTDDPSSDEVKVEREAFLNAEIADMQLVLAQFKKRNADPKAVKVGRALEVEINTEQHKTAVRINEVYKDQYGIFLRCVREYDDVSVYSLARCAAYMERAKLMENDSDQVVEGDPKLLRGYLDYRATLN